MSWITIQLQSQTVRRRFRAIAASTIVALVIILLGSLRSLENITDAQTVDLGPRILLTGAGRGYFGTGGAISDGNFDDGDTVLGRLPAYDFEAVLTPTSHAQNIVLDENTGLMWIRSISALDDIDGAGAHGNVRLDDTLSWQSALETSRELEYAGFTDWRLPTVSELDTILDFGVSEPALNRAVFPEPYEAFPSPYFWTSTSSPKRPSNAYYVNSRDGHRHPWVKHTLFSVRPVRRAIEPGATETGEHTVAVLQTGQLEGYFGNTGEIGAGNGDDGDLKPGEAREYEWSDDGTIDDPKENVANDLVTGLTWIRVPTLLDGLGESDDVRGIKDFAGAMDWPSAVERCRLLDYAGLSDWRLPNIRELDSIIQPGRLTYPLDQATFFPLSTIGAPVARSWWSSTTSAFAPDMHAPGEAAWYVEATLPPTRHYVVELDHPAKGHLRHTRCVRGEYPWPGPHVGGVRMAREFSDLAADVGHERSETKWVMDADPEDGTGLPVELAFQDTKIFPLHLEFLRSEFPRVFGGLSPADYVTIAGHRATRTIYAGSVLRILDPDEDHDIARQRPYRYSWDVYTAIEDPSEAPTLQEAVDIHTRLSRLFRRRPLYYSPTDSSLLTTALTWNDPRLPVRPVPPTVPEISGYEAYTPGVVYGTVRIMTRAELAAAVAEGALDRRDIIVVSDGAPSDLGQVVAGIVTATPQGALSHLAVRSARRGTPNGYVDGAATVFEAFEGTLVQLVLATDSYSVSPATLEEADAWWAGRRPEPIPIKPIDSEHIELDDLTSMSAAPDASIRFGGKASNLATLFTFLPEANQVPGFAVPFAWFDQMLESPAGSTPPPGAETLREWVTHLVSDPEMAEGSVRAARLEALTDAIREAPANASLVGLLALRLDEVFGPGVMVRFRSSSNAEDGLRFNGAGLYDSTSVCAADSLDDDEIGPSHCDPDQSKERTIERGLGKVWASLYTLRAWEERDWYGIDQTAAAMAILVTPAFPDERANGVAFTGDPADPSEPIMLVSAQEGDASVVAPASGELPERSGLVVKDGRLDGIRRIQASTLVPEGEFVLSDAELLSLGEILLQADAFFPLDLSEAPGTEREDVMLDLEFKVRRGDDALLIKQIRPFLPPAIDASVTLFAPEPLELCGMWRTQDDVLLEFRDEAQVTIAAGEALVPLDRTDPSVPPDLIEAVLLGPERRVGRTARTYRGGGWDKPVPRGRSASHATQTISRPQRWRGSDRRSISANRAARSGHRPRARQSCADESDRSRNLDHCRANGSRVGKAPARHMRPRGPAGRDDRRSV